MSFKSHLLVDFAGFLSNKMPTFYEATETGETTESASVKVHYWKPLLCLTFLYFVITCGIERIYQPMVSHR